MSLSNPFTAFDSHILSILTSFNYSLPRFKVTSGAHEFEVRQKNEELKAERQRAKAAAMERQAAAGRGTASSGIRLNNSRLFSRGGRVGAGGRGVSKFIVHGKVDPKLVAAKGVPAPSGSEQVTEDISAADDGKEGLPDADGEGQADQNGEDQADQDGEAGDAKPEN